MNIAGHIAVGATGFFITGNPLFFIGSLLPDIVLLPNELRRKRFNKWDVKYKILYNFTHSLYFPILLLPFFPVLTIAILIHIVIDIPFHSSSFRWRPFMVNTYKPQKKALLLSGGLDSGLCAFLEKDFDCYFFNYGQSYLKQEQDKAEKFCKYMGFKLNIINKNWYTDIPNRNFLMISELVIMGYDEIIIGSRNILPIFDKHKDSNWLNLKIYQYLFKVYINTPLIGMFKWQIKHNLNKYGYSNFYCTENVL